MNATPMVNTAEPATAPGPMTRPHRRRRVHRSRRPLEFRYDHADNKPFTAFTRAPKRLVMARRLAAHKVAKAARKANRKGHK